MYTVLTKVTEIKQYFSMRYPDLMYRRIERGII